MIQYIFLYWRMSTDSWLERILEPRKDSEKHKQLNPFWLHMFHPGSGWEVWSIRREELKSTILD